MDPTQSTTNKTIPDDMTAAICVFPPVNSWTNVRTNEVPIGRHEKSPPIKLQAAC